MAIFGLILGGLLVQSIDSSLKTDWISSAIFGFLFFIYYSDLMQKIDNTTTLLNRHCYDSFSSKLNGQLDKLRADDEHIPTVSVGYTEYEPSESFTDAFARADEMMYNVKRKAAAAI